MPSPSRRTLASVVLLAAATLGSIGAASVTAAQAAPTVKAPIRGLIDRQGAPKAAALAYVSGYVVKVNWADLQPVRGGEIAADNAIDRAIARVRLPDFAGRMTLKLRVVAGIGAPEWAKEIGGRPLPFLNPQTGTTTLGGTIGRFWLPEFGAAYADLQAKLAAKYDGIPELREVTVSRCSTIYDELFIRQRSPVSNTTVLLGAGYTKQADQLCIKEAIDAHQVWQQTSSDVAFNPFPNVGATSGSSMDEAYTEATMDYCRAALGQRCGLENNSLSVDKLASTTYQQMYAHMSALGGTLPLQTATVDRIGSWPAALDGAIAIGATSVELPAGYQKWPAGSLAPLAQRIARSVPKAARAR